MGILLTREGILQADDRLRERVEVPEWGGDIFVAEFGGAERDWFEENAYEPDPEDEQRRVLRKGNFRARLVALCAVDASGKRLFTEADVTALGAKSYRALNRVCNVALRINKLAAAEVEKEAENFDDLPGGGSSTI